MATKPTHVMAIDQGTTGSTVLVFDRRGRIAGRAYSSSASTTRSRAGSSTTPRRSGASRSRSRARRSGRPRSRRRRSPAIGITNQRETTVVWDRRTGQPIHRAIVWQDRRTADVCAGSRHEGAEAEVRAKTGLVLDPYFSGTKVAWILDNVRGARARAAAGDLVFGTIDSWLVWKLTAGKVHVTDPTNASRTLLFNIHGRGWDPELLRLFDVPMAMVPEVRPSSGVIGRDRAAPPRRARPDRRDRRRPAGGALRAGLFRARHGEEHLRHRLLRADADRQRGGRLRARARDDDRVRRGRRTDVRARRLGRSSPGRVDPVAARRPQDPEARPPRARRWRRKAKSTLGVYVVPAFVGLGAPYWDPEARGAILGLTRGVEPRAPGPRRASNRSPSRPATSSRPWPPTRASRSPRLRVDGGASANDFLMQFQADVLGTTVDRPKVVETTATGAAFLAGLGTSFWTQAELERVRAVDKVFKPKMKAERARGGVRGLEGRRGAGAEHEGVTAAVRCENHRLDRPLPPERPAA